MLGGGFAGVAGLFAIFTFGGVPKIRNDILSKIPFIGSFYVHEIAPEDNPF